MSKFHNIEEVQWLYEHIKTDLVRTGTCDIYRGVPDKYPDLKKRLGPAGREVRISGQKLTLLVKLNKTELEKGLECSHLCHNKGCMNTEHIVAEPHYVNMDRKRCQIERADLGSPQLCFGHRIGDKTYPDCI